MRRQRSVREYRNDSLRRVSSSSDRKRQVQDKIAAQQSEIVIDRRVDDDFLLRRNAIRTKIRRRRQQTSVIPQYVGPANYNGQAIESIVSVTTTATLRPEILRRTYESFSKNMIDVDFKKLTLYMNIDLVPEGDHEAVVSVAREFFGEVAYNVGTTPNFARAVKWCWSRPTTDFILNIEDDWELMYPITLQEAFSIFAHNPQIYQVALRCYSAQRGLVLLPSLIRRIMYSTVASRLTEDRNPEYQMRTMAWNDSDVKITQENVMVYPKDKVIRDTGREWLRTTDYIRGKDAEFNAWNRKS